MFQSSKIPVFLLSLVCFLPSLIFADTSEETWKKSMWIHKVAKTLGQTEGINKTDDLQQLLSMERAQIIAYFMKKPTYGDASLNAFLHYLGRSVDNLKSPDLNGPGFAYHFLAEASPQALVSARRVLDEQPLELFEANPTLMVKPMTDARIVFKDLPQEQQRPAIFKAMLSALDESIEAFKASDGQLDKVKGCAALPKLYTAVDFGIGFMAAGFGYQLESAIHDKWLLNLVDDPNQWSEGDACERSEITAESIVEQLQLMRKAYEAIFAGIPASSPSSIQNLQDYHIIKAFDRLPPLNEAFTYQSFWTRVQNTSTNFNRKRSAYLLRTYFCDELGPIEVEATQHTGGKHGSDPGCMSCHYKLDPMAGLTRFHGIDGENFQGKDYIEFDDFISFSGPELKSYYDAWNNSKGELEVGYFTEPGVKHPDWKGDSLNDLLSFAKTNREAQTCFVRRMAESFIGTNISFDGAWLNGLTDEYLKASNTGLGFKKLTERLLLSQAFATQNPQRGTCYDIPADASKNRPPCAIASIAESNCKSCHSKAYASGGLDLTQWLDMGEGNFSFPHIKNGVQLEQKVSFQILRKRIIGTELGPKMPLGRAMMPTDRQKMYEWFTRVLEQ